jgi:NAD(P) transhydrogenase subunit alpha
LFLEQAGEVDIIITTALIPGRKAPVLITDEMVQVMRTGSVVVDMAAEQGGNCECTVPDQAIEAHGVTIIGYTDLTSRLATHASQYFGTNVSHLLDDLGGNENFKIDLDDEVVLMSLVLHEGRVTWPPSAEARAVFAPKKPQPAPAPVAAPAPAAVAKKKEPGSSAGMVGAVAAGLLLVVGLFAPPDFVQHFTVFILACFVGWQVVWNVTPALHTPLMSVTNAISGIIVVGGLLQASTGHLGLAAILGSVALLVATINIAGGFLVTRRMLNMFRKEG